MINDLRPYVCLFRECPKADETYGVYFAYVFHEHSVHGGDSSSLESYPRISRSDCVFCGYVLPEALSERKQHIRRHMEEIAFTVVTKPYEDWEFYSDASSPRH